MTRAPVHFSTLKFMAQSPAHYRAALEREFEETPAMRFGSCVHVLALGGEVIRFPGERKGNAWAAFKGLVAGDEHYVFDGKHSGKAWEWAKEEAGDRLIVTSEDLALAEKAVVLQSRRRELGRYDAPIVIPEEYERAQACADAVRRHPVVLERGFLEGEVEIALEWQVMGRGCGGRLDVMALKRVTELKVSTSADPDWFPRHAINMHWHCQLEWYRVAAREQGRTIDECAIVAVESKPPFAVTCFVLTDRALEAGRRQLRLWMERLLSCEETGEFPEYVQSAVDLDIEDELALDWSGVS